MHPRALPAGCNGNSAPSCDPLDADAAAVHLVFQVHHRRAVIVPHQPGTRRAALDDLAGEERVDIVNRIELGGGGILPAEAERTHAPLHLAQHEARLFEDARGRDVAAPDDVIPVIAPALWRLATA